MMGAVSYHPPQVTLGLGPRGLHLTTAPQMQRPLVRTEGDDPGLGAIE